MFQATLSKQSGTILPLPQNPSCSQANQSKTRQVYNRINGWFDFDVQDDNASHWSPTNSWCEIVNCPQPPIGHWCVPVCLSFSWLHAGKSHLQHFAGLGCVWFQSATVANLGLLSPAFSQQILTLQVVIVYNVVAIGTDHKNTYDQWIPLDFHLYYLVVHALMVAMVPEHCGLLGFDTKIEKVSWMPHSCDCFFYSTCHTVVWSLINLSWTRSFPQGQ